MVPEVASKTGDLYSQKIHGRYFDPARRTTVPDRYRAIVAAVKEISSPPLGPVLEVGSESPIIPQYWMGQLGVSRSEVRLVEVSPTSAELLRQAGFVVESLDVSFERLPLPDHSISVVLLSEVIEHLLDPDFALDEVRRVLRPRGTLIVTTPNLACWINRISLPLGWQPIFTETGTEWVFNRGKLIRPTRPVGHLHVFTLGAVKSLLEFHGFSIAKTLGLRIEIENLSQHGWRMVDGAAAHFPSLASGFLLAASSSG